ncbi:Lipase 2 [Cyphellophora attinorum]|uniref:Lipase 2 n=1 Tax=Cyphellophora attinorum TaxID=1664694 RepID=A0A0N1NWZ6_9EURO|nr:Lipase 2 [Phialophora attinorum]KPI37373.1 Lipase 2 [Phialophora attinorum]
MRCAPSRARLCHRGSGRILRPSARFKHDVLKDDLTVDPRLSDLGVRIKDEFAVLRDKYEAPKYPIVLAHGLLGFDELRLAGKWLPGVQYWRGIREALEGAGVQVVTTTVPTTGSISERAGALDEQIRERAHGDAVNIVAHSMGGLDARYLISRLQPSKFKVKSLTTIATPHRGSSAADMLFRDIGVDNVNQLYKLLGRLKVDTGAFAQLTRGYIMDTFNPVVPNDPDVRYFSYGAAATPHILSVFRLSHDLMDIIEGPNDGLVSVASSRWGEYKGTLMGVTHLDLINWTNRLKRLAALANLVKPEFNAIAFYLSIADMLAKEGL